MKLFWFLVVFIFILSCKDPNDKNKIASDSFNTELLLGKWKRTNDSNDKQTYESWRYNESNIPMGSGFTLLKTDTIWKENISIINVDGFRSLVVVDTKKEKTVFKFISETKNSFKCHNPHNEFPKFIEYIVSPNKIKAIISDEENSIDFLFNRINS